MAGVSRLQYTDEVRLVRVMCSGRVDLDFIFRAFLNGQDGVLIGGCRLDECNYATHGNYDALSNTYICKKMMARLGLNPERLRIEFMSGADGNLLVEVVNDFARTVRQIGPLGQSEGHDVKGLDLKLRAARKLVPYIKLVERERLRAPAKSKAAYEHYFAGEDFERLFDELIGSRLTLSLMMMLLRENPLSTGEIAESLGLSPSEVSAYMNRSSRQGLVRFDEGRQCYLPA